MERSDPRRESQWRALVIDGETFYACPDEFPPDDGGVAAFKAAYLKVMTKCIELSNAHAAERGHRFADVSGKQSKVRQNGGM